MAVYAEYVALAAAHVRRAELVGVEGEVADRFRLGRVGGRREPVAVALQTVVARRHFGQLAPLWVRVTGTLGQVAQLPRAAVTEALVNGERLYGASATAATGDDVIGGATARRRAIDRRVQVRRAVFERHDALNHRVVDHRRDGLAVDGSDHLGECR